MYKKKLIYLIFYILLLEKANQTILEVNKEKIVSNEVEYKIDKILN